MNLNYDTFVFSHKWLYKTNARPQTKCILICKFDIEIIKWQNKYLPPSPQKNPNTKQNNKQQKTKQKQDMLTSD